MMPAIFPSSTNGRAGGSATNSPHVPTGVSPVRGVAHGPIYPLGFTLMEVLIVVTILGIVVAAALPVVENNIRSPKLRTAANVLAADVEFTASECIGHPNAPRAMVFDTTHNKYTVEDLTAGTAIKNPGDGLDFINDFASGRNAQLSGVTITGITMGSSTLSVLTFDAYGKPLITADLVITLAYNGQTMTVTVKQTTGDTLIAG